MDEIWVRNKNIFTNKVSSQWHLLHSVRAYSQPARRHDWGWNRTQLPDRFVEGFALTYCGQVFEGPQGRYIVPKGNSRCSGCSTVADSLNRYPEVPREMLVVDG
jgi:hypothetical protein